MNKLLREHAAYRAYCDVLAEEPGSRFWGGFGELWGTRRSGPRRALNRRLNKALRGREPGHEPLGAMLLRRARARPQLMHLPAVDAALRAVDAAQKEGV
ncbi:hypothetical protein [Paraburkholderia tropica]|uniref:hypothetical protein n=1 Tax=Paraburkholderia tropica TaxID=92647 RepID=UPI002AB721D0|nr:hypothetical protein [Paraburkholderia tropica]